MYVMYFMLSQTSIVWMLIFHLLWNTTDGLAHGPTAGSIAYGGGQGVETSLDEREGFYREQY